MSMVESLFLSVLERSCEATALVILAGLFLALLRHRIFARWHAVVWLVVMARLVLPQGPSSPWSVFNWVPADLTARALREAHPAETSLLAGGGEAVGDEGDGMAARRMASGSPGGFPVSRPFAPRWSVLLAWAWLIGGWALLLRLGLQTRDLAAKLQQGKPVTDPAILNRLDGCRRELALATPMALIETPHVRSPALFGPLPRRLFLPVGVLNQLNAAQQRCLFLHELAHVKRWDPFLNWALGLLRLVHWFNPLVAYAFHRWRRDRELACDERVLAMEHRCPPGLYGETLIRLLELAAARDHGPRWTGFLGGRAEAEARIQNISRFEGGPRGRILPAALISLLMVVGFTSARTAAPPPRTTSAQSANPRAADATLDPPRIVATSPPLRTLDVDPALKEITVTFDRDMASGFSWTGGGPDFPVIPEGQKPHWRDSRTCVLPVRLEPARYYRVGINSTSHLNFRSREGVPARVSVLCFTTLGASREVQRRVRQPEIVAFDPPNADQAVDPSRTQISVTFNLPMGQGFSWTGGGPAFPTIPEGKSPRWSADRLTCVLPVQLEPGRNYRLGLNSPSHRNFQSADGVPLEPVTYTFRTAAVRP
jgi:beta-lactamase regulating signal transducer with metallopeptidase domain